MNKEEIQKKVLQFQYMEASLKGLQERAQLVSQRMDDVQRTMLALEDLEKTKPSDAYIPIGHGNYVQGKIEDTKEIMVNVGGGIVLKKKREEAKGMLEEKLKVFENDLKEISVNAQKILTELQKIQEDIQKLQV